MNLFTEIRKKHGQNAVKQIRDLENTEKKIGRHHNHLVFSLRYCKELDLTPPSLNLKCPIKTSKARDIVKKA